jgi:hypothetical protein
MFVTHVWLVSKATQIVTYTIITKYILLHFGFH